MATSPGRIETTPPRALGIAAGVGALTGALVVIAANLLDVVPPLVPWTAPIAVALIAALVGGIAWTTHQRIQVRRERMEAQRAVAFLVLGKASALAGALVAAGYLAFALSFVSRWDVEGPRERVIRAGVAVLAGVGLMVAGLRLERACKVPEPPDDDDDEDDIGAARDV